MAKKIDVNVKQHAKGTSNNNYAEKLAKGGVFVAIIYIVGAVIGYGLRIYISRNLSVEEFGVLYSVMAFVSSFVVFRDFGLQTSITIKVPQFLFSGNPGKIKEIIKKSILIQLSASAIIIFLVIAFSSVLMPNIKSSSFTILEILFASFFISVFIDIFRSSLQGTKQLIAYSSIEPLRVSLVFVLCYILFSMGKGMSGVAFSYLIASVVLAAAVPIYFWKKNRNILKAHAVKTSRQEFMSFALIVWAASLFNSILSYADTVLLAVLRAPKEAGFYQAALPTAQLLTFVLMPVVVIILPFVSEMWARKDKIIINNMASFSVKMLMIIIIPAAIVMEAISNNIILFLFGDKFAPAIPVLQLLIVGMFFYSFIPLFIAFIDGTNNPRENIKIMASMGIINVILDIILIPLFGPMGAAIALSAAYLIGVIVAFHATKKTVNFTVQYKNIAKAVFGGIIMLAVILYLKNIIQFTSVVESLVLIVVSIALYSVYIFAVKIIDKRDIELIKTAKVLPRQIENLLEKIARS